MKKTILGASLAVCMSMSLMTGPAFAAESDAFTDIEGHWAESSIERWTDYDVVDGKGNGIFDPDGVMTRAEFAKVLATTMGLEKKADVSAFADLEEGAWYVSPIAQCVEAGILNGTGNNTMSPLAPISREQAFTMIARAFGIVPVEKELPFADADTVSDYALGYVAAMNEYGWVNGVSGGGFAPLDDITRGSVMSLLDRIVTVYSNTDKAEVTCDGGVVLLTGDNATLTGKADLVVVTGQNVNLDKGQFEQVIVLSDDGKIVANKDAVVEHLQLDGSGNTVSGTGTVKDVLANGNNNTINTKNTKVTAGEETTGTKAGNKNVAAGGSVTTPSGSTGGGGGGTVVPDENEAQLAVEGAWDELNKALEDFKGHDGAQLVTATRSGDQFALTLNVDAIMAGNAAVGEDVLNGLATRLKKALDDHFGQYVLTVADQKVYDKGAFQNTELKNALFAVSQGFFEYLSKMEADANGVYTYKTVSAKAEGTDSYNFNISVKMTGEDVAKVQKLAKSLADHLSMEKLSSDEITNRYGITVNETEAFVVTMEMPDALMKKAVEIAEGKGISAEQMQNTFDSVTVGRLLNELAKLNLNDILGSGADEINSVLTTVNSNANVINKVLSKLTVQVNDTPFFTGDHGVFTPGTEGSAWQNFMSGVVGMTSDGIKEMTPGQFKDADGSMSKDNYYAVPVTVTVDLESSMGFTATETVVVVLHIDFSAYANTNTETP
ncbi:S-layer homology domain-containing protein [Flavonifractor porci]|uniref:S-layer homology domain-containing protein n=1 Tax=Flavonifractor porci TaxID=3133422 RepID=UPI003094CF55